MTSYPSPMVSFIRESPRCPAYRSKRDQLQEDAVREVLRFEPEVPEACMVHGYVKAAEEDRAFCAFVGGCCGHLTGVRSKINEFSLGLLLLAHDPCPD